MSTYDEMRYELIHARRIPDINSLPVDIRLVADRAGLFRKTIRWYETGRTMPTVDNFVKWSAGIGKVMTLTGETTTFESTASFAISTLITARIVRGYSQRDIAVHIGSSHAQVGAWEGRRLSPVMPNFIAWCEALGYTVGLGASVPITTMEAAA